MKRFVLLCVDLLLITAATLLAVLLRDNFVPSAQHFQALFPYLVTTLGCAAVILTISGTSRAMWRFTSIGDYLRIAMACTLTVLASLALAFSFSRLDGVARAVPILQLLLMTTLLISARILIRLRNRRRFKPVQLKNCAPIQPRTSILVFGATTLTELYLRSITEFATDRIHVVGIVARKEAKVGRSLLGYKVLGTTDAFSSIINELFVHGVRVDRISVMMAHAKLTSLEQRVLAEIEEQTDILVQYLDEFALIGVIPDGSAKHQQPSDVSLPDVAFSLSEARLAKLAERTFWRAKRVFDIVLALAALVLAAPVAILVTLLVAIDVGRPVTFWQQRPGVGGYPFRVYKFRTMAAAHSADGRRVLDANRSSTIGRFLRRSRLDELPQLYNILAGHMSFVGPRPLLPIDQPAAYAARMFVRPGLTGWAQVNGGRAVSAADKAALDIWYIEHASFALDLKIFARTFVTVLFGEHLNAAMIGRAWSDLNLSGTSQRKPNARDVDIVGTPASGSANAAAPRAA